MSFSLYDAIVPTYLQILGSVAGLIDKAESYCAEHKLDPAELIQARLAEDMLPFAFQVRSVAMHSETALKAAFTGHFSPERTPLPTDFESLRARIAGAIEYIKSIVPAELDARVGQDLVFQYDVHRTDYIVENFLLSFSQPNFYFHASTAYGILRAKGLQIGKRDYLGTPRVKR